MLKKASLKTGIPLIIVRNWKYLASAVHLQPRWKMWNVVGLYLQTALVCEKRLAWWKGWEVGDPLVLWWAVREESTKHVGPIYTFCTCASVWSMGMCGLVFYAESTLLAVNGCINFRNRSGMLYAAWPWETCRALSGVQRFPLPLGSDGHCRSPRELLCAAVPKTNMKANMFSQSTYTPKLWFVFLRWGYRKEKFLIVHLKKRERLSLMETSSCLHMHPLPQAGQLGAFLNVMRSTRFLPVLGLTARSSQP